MIVYLCAAVFLLLFAVSFRRDRRRFRNAVYLGFASVCLALAVLGQVGRSSMGVLGLVIALLALLLGLGTMLMPLFLIANGVRMVRREGRSLGNLLSLLAGLGIIGLVALLVLAVALRTRWLTVATASLLLVAGYASFLFLCFVLYSVLYGRLPVRKDVDFVVVLGSGLVDGARVGRLLGNRLDRGRAVYEAQAARSRAPMLLVSGGRGPDEELSEAEAMAGYLVERGFPADRILRETRSRTTGENMAFSNEIMAAAEPGYRCVVVTNNYHAFRAALLARKTGVNGQVIGAPTAAYFWPSATIREFAAVLLTYWKTNLTVCALLVAAAVTAALGAGA
ncbi:YdcF family protein [Spirillospora sp. NPDC127200]